MKKITLLLFVFFTMLVNAQTGVVVVGANSGTTSTTGYPAPLQDYYKNSRQQFLYTAAELSGSGLAAGNITQIGWNVVAVGTSALEEGYTISIKSTALTALTTTFETGATVVYGPTDFTPSATGNVMFTLTTPFNWDGTSNLIIEICEGATSGSYTTNVQTVYSTLSFNGSNYYRSDTTPACPMATGTVSTTRPQLILNGAVAPCLAPTALVSSAVTTTGATVSWTASVSTPAQGYEYYYATTNTAPTASTTPSGSVAAGVVTANLTGLTPATTYYVWVRSKCSASDTSAWSAISTTFTTLCLPLTSLPWTENFDSLTPGTNVFPTCWAYLNTTSDWSISTTPTAYSGANSLRRTWSTDGWAFTPIATLTAGTSYTLSYFMRTNDAIVGYDITVATGTGQTVTDMTNTLSTVTAYQGPTWTKFTHAFTPTTTGNYSFGVRVVAPNPPNGINFDDFKLEVTPTCLEPTALVSSAVTTTGATVSWTASVSTPAQGYEYYYATTNTAPTASTTPSGSVAAGVVTANLTGLTPATTYYVWVRSKCSASDTSSWSSATSFTTLCVAVTSFSEGFDASLNFPVCWAKVGTLGSANVQASTGTPSAPNNLYIFSGSVTTQAVVSMTPVSNAGAGTHRLKFKARANFTVGGIIEVGYLTNPTDDTSFVGVAQFATTSTSVYDNFVAELGTDPGTSQVLAFRHKGNPANSVLIDDVVWEPIPSCNEPTALVSSAVTTTGATVSWTAPSSAPAQGYEYYYATTNTAPTASTTPSGSVAAGVVTANLTGLTPATTYYVWVRSKCSASDLSAWSGNNTSFTTLCLPLTSLPWTENFDSLTPGTNVFPTCWSYVNTTSTWSISTTPTAYSGANSLRRTWSTDGWAFTPTATLTAGTSYTFSYYMRTNDTTVGYDVTVATGTGQTVTDMTNTLSTVTAYQGPTWTKFTHEFTPTTTGNYSFGVRVVAPVAPNGINFDDFKLELTPSTPPSCATNIVATPDPACGNFATTITWQATPGANGYKLTIGTTPGGTQVLNNSNIGSVTTYSFAGNFNTTYYYKLVPFNNVGDATGCTESSFTTFATGCYCTTLPTSNDDSGITNVVLGSTNFATPDVMYYNHTATPVTLSQGINTNLQISFATGYTYNTYVWIDFNDNFTFESSELLFTGESASTNPTTLNASFIMPANATLGTHRMRIVTADTLTTPDPCYSSFYGVSLDFTVNIVVATCTPPAATATIALGCTNNQYNINVNVTALGNGTPSISDGTNTWSITTTGVVVAGPFANGSTVTLTVLHGSDPTCNLPLGTFVYNCPPANDNCGTAVTLTLGGVFVDNAVVATNVGATNSNPPAPGCASFSGGDVWYSVTVPASGSITIETNSNSGSTLTDTGMAVYSGACGALVLVECDDDDSTDGNFSKVALTGRTPGEVLYVSAWEYGNDTFNTFKISAYDASLNSPSFDSASFVYYPNPVKDVLHLSYSQNISKVEIINLLGQQVLSQSMNANQTQIDMSRLNSGAYLVRVTSEGQVKTIKVIKE